MTKKEVVQLIQSNAAIAHGSLTDAGTTVWDYSLAQDVTWTASATRTLSMTNMPSGVCYGMMKYLGTAAPTLPGDSSSVYVNPNGTTLIGFRYDGAFKWSSDFQPASSGGLTQLAAPTLNLAQETTTQVGATVGTVAHASSYVLQHSADNSTWSNIATAAGLTHDSGRTLGTITYYRAKAVGDGTTYSDSAWTTGNITTQNVQTAVALDFNPVVGLTQLQTTGVNNGNWQGSRTQSTEAWGNYGQCTKKLAANTDGWISFKIGEIPASNVIFGFNAVQELVKYQGYEVAMWINGSIQLMESAVGGATVPYVLNKTYRLRFTGVDCFIDSSTDELTWTQELEAAYKRNVSADMFINLDINDTAAIAYQPKGYGLATA